MADELDPVEQRFIADVEPYIEAVERAAHDARDFADANLEASAAIGDMRDHALEAVEADHSLRDSALEAGAALGHLRDEALAAGEAEKALDDHVGGLRSRLQSLAGMADKFGGEGGLIGKLLGGLPGSGGSTLGVLGNLSGLSAGGAGIAAAIGALLVEIDGLASGFAAAGAGAGAFALLAMPAFKSVSAAYTQIQTDQKAYNDALTATARNTALQKLKRDYADLDPAERGALHGLQDLMDTYHRMAKAFEPDAFKVFNDGLRIANQLLPDIKPFADTFASSLDGLLKQVSKFAGSSGFKDWLAQFQKLEGPSIAAIGRGIGQVAVAIGKLLTTMSAKDVVNAINIAFTVLSGTISALDFIIRRVMLRWDQWQQAFRETRRAVAELGHDIATWFDRIRSAVAEAMDAVVARVDQDVDRVRESIHRWYGDLVQAADWFRALPGRIMAELSRLPGQMLALGRNAIEGFLRGIESAAGGLLGEVSHLAGEVSGAFSKVLGILSPSRVFYQHAVNTLQGYINGVRAKSPELLALMRELGGHAGSGFGGAGAYGALAGAGGPSLAGGGGGAPVYNVTVHVAGSVLSEQNLVAAVQEGLLRRNLVNANSGIWPGNRGPMR